MTDQKINEIETQILMEDEELRVSKKVSFRINKEKKIAIITTVETGLDQSGVIEKIRSVELSFTSFIDIVKSSRGKILNNFDRAVFENIPDYDKISVEIRDCIPKIEEILKNGRSGLLSFITDSIEMSSHGQEYDDDEGDISNFSFEVNKEFIDLVETTFLFCYLTVNGP